MASHALQFLFFYEDVISVYYNTQEIPHNLIIGSQFLMYDVLKITVCQFSSVGTRALVNMDTALWTSF